MSVEFALSDAAVAFRYHFPQDELDLLPRKVLREATTFHIAKAEDDIQLAQPYDASKSQYQTFYQPRDDREQARIGSVKHTGKSPYGFGLPAMFRATIGGRQAWLMLKEAGFDGSAPASHIARISEDGTVSLAFPMPFNGNDAFGEGMPEMMLPWTSPWRILTLGSSPQTLIQDTSVTDLSQPTQIEDITWIQPGSTSWSWYANPSNPMNFSAAKAYIDLAAERGWPYSLLDATWDRQTEDGEQVTLEETSQYARSRDVRLWVWMNSAGPNNNASDVTPRDLLFDAATRRKTMQWLVDLNVAGIKVDGIESEKQGMMQYLLDILADAANFKLMIVFHNCPVPHGWERTWPNLLSSEGLVTSEYYTNKIAYAPQMPENNVNEAFVRLTIGPADYAPGTISQDIYPQDAPLTTVAHEIALFVIIDTGLRCFPESPQVYRGVDHEVMSLLSRIPFVWDETRFLMGEPGKFFVVAKRKGHELYIAGINGETVHIAESRTDRAAQGAPRRISLAIAELGIDKPVLSVADLPDSREIQINAGVSSNSTHINVLMEPFGGFVVVVHMLHGQAQVASPDVTAQRSDWFWIQALLIVLPVVSLAVLLTRWKPRRILEAKRAL
ncbi:hypothetical protein AMS68_001772 [Peltaster fructicola]|uniref:alpha-galactosidase n=1 Tax=Peltaster fructicola TaxID=286661 RepID=A0A6H0XNN8_9PEZI|nr:hypothetical protein AMS68_001772 [Peltaster fructicola]